MTWNTVADSDGWNLFSDGRFRGRLSRSNGWTDQTVEDILAILNGVSRAI